MRKLTCDHSISMVLGRVQIYSALPSYLFMYPNCSNKLAIIVRIEGRSGAVTVMGDVRFGEATEEDVRALLARTKLSRCLKCKAPAFDPEVMDTNRKGLCEACFMRGITEEMEEARARIEAEKHRTDQKMRDEGHKYRVNGWIHPADGEEFECTFYTARKPSKRGVEAALKKRGSLVLDDYTVTAL